MKASKEKKILHNIIKKIESDKPSILNKIWFEIVLWLACVVLFYIAFRYYETTSNIFIPLIISTTIGISIGMITMLQSGEKIWPYLEKHIDKNSIEERINQI